MNDPLVVIAARQFKAALLRGEQEQQQTMARQWLRIEQALDADITALAYEIDTRRRDGLPVTPNALFTLTRWRALSAQVSRQLGGFVAGVLPGILGYQQTMAMDGAEHAAALITMQTPASFLRLATDAVITMTGLTADGTPLADLLRQRVTTDAVSGITNALITAAARGWNPTKTAREIRDGASIGLQRALVLARNEGLRAYREASRAQYEQSGLVTGFRRLATRDPRTCIACLVADGETYPVRETLRAHVQCRCTTVPTVIGAAPPAWQTGSAWLREQDAATQRNIMGAQRYDAWKRGASLQSMVAVRKDAVWGDAVVPAAVPAAVR